MSAEQRVASRRASDKTRVASPNEQPGLSSSQESQESWALVLSDKAPADVDSLALALAPSSSSTSESPPPNPMRVAHSFQQMVPGWGVGYRHAVALHEGGTISFDGEHRRGRWRKSSVTSPPRSWSPVDDDTLTLTFSWDDSVPPKTRVYTRIPHTWGWWSFGLIGRRDFFEVLVPNRGSPDL